MGLSGQYPSQRDLTAFLDLFRSDAKAATFTVLPLNGGGYSDPNNPGTECEVGIRYTPTTAMAYPTPLVFYSVGGYGMWSPMGEIQTRSLDLR